METNGKASTRVRKWSRSALLWRTSQPESPLTRPERAAGGRAGYKTTRCVTRPERKCDETRAISGCRYQSVEIIWRVFDGVIRMLNDGMIEPRRGADPFHDGDGAYDLNQRDVE